MPRAFLVVMDSVGCGGAPDAASYGDEGANTLLSIARACADGHAKVGRSGPLRLPTLDCLGLGAAVRLACGEPAPGLDAHPQGLWAAATEHSAGKDTPTGHWELAGVPVPWRWHLFPETRPCFPPEVTEMVARAAGCDGLLGNCHASGTAIVAELGAEHLRTLRPICYTSADSVFQIAAHEEAFGLDRLLTLCATVAPRLHAMKVGRVIARPFTGSAEAGFTRTANRRDFAAAPPSPTLCDWTKDAGRTVHAIGKIHDIFSGQGITRTHKGASDAELFDHLDRLARDAEDGSLVFANFVEFDSLYGHRRDVSGYARALEWFDTRVAAFLGCLRAGDLAVFTADHGNDPTWRGTDHTRERVPVVGWGVGPHAAGHARFADVAATIAYHLDIKNLGPGRSLLP